MLQVEVFVIKFSAIYGFSSSTVVVSEVTSLTHLISAKSRRDIQKLDAGMTSVDLKEL